MYSAVRTMNKKIVVIGGGAAGMMAALSAAEQGAQVTLLEPTNDWGKTEYHRKGPVQRDQQYRY